MPENRADFAATAHEVWAHSQKASTKPGHRDGARYASAQPRNGSVLDVGPLAALVHRVADRFTTAIPRSHVDGNLLGYLAVLNVENRDVI